MLILTCFSHHSLSGKAGGAGGAEQGAAAVQPAAVHPADWRLADTHQLAHRPPRAAGAVRNGTSSTGGRRQQRCGSVSHYLWEKYKYQHLKQLGVLSFSCLLSFELRQVQTQQMSLANAKPLIFRQIFHSVSSFMCLLNATDWTFKT